MISPDFPLRTKTGPHRFSVQDVSRMIEIGVIDPDIRIELLDGQILRVASGGPVDLTLKDEVTRLLVVALGREWRIIPGGPLYLAPNDAPRPDFYVVARTSDLMPADPAAIPLVVEIADNSLGHDLGRKSGKYAQYGLAEYWVVDVKARETHVLRYPHDNAYRDITSVPFDAVLTCRALPAVTVRFDDLVPPTS